MHLGGQDEKHAMKGPLKPCFIIGVDLVGLIPEHFPPSMSCESSALGEGMGWQAQVAHRYVFVFCAYQHSTYQLLFCIKAEKPLARLWLGNRRGKAGKQQQRSTVPNVLPHLPELWLITSTAAVSVLAENWIAAWESRVHTTLLQ